jgi:3-oxoacyl-[acyl-carrier-protein] synthase II
VRSPDYNRRVVITGMGVVSPIGNDAETSWKNLLAGVSGLDWCTRWPGENGKRDIAGEVKDFDPSLYLDTRTVRRSERSLWMGVGAAKMAVADANLAIEGDFREDVGIVFGSGAGGQTLFHENLFKMQQRGHRAVSPTFIAHGLVDSTSGMIAIETGAIGHNVAIVSACATGTHAIGEGAEAIKRGDCLAVIAGSTENPLMEVAYAGFENMRGLGSPRPDEPITTISRPFDLTRNGFILGEGAGALILEDLEHAQARGAKIYAEVKGYGSTADGFDMAIPIEHGNGSMRAMKLALQRQGLRPDQIDMINPHGTSTPAGDKAEYEAIAAVFGEHTPQIAISATKSMTGHMMGAAGSFEAWATIMAIHEQICPPTINYRDPDPEIPLRIITEATPMEIRYALSNNIGLGGHNGAVIFGRFDG